MIIAIIVLAYVVNVFLNRWLNKIVYKQGYDEIAAWAWFLYNSYACYYIRE
jgi:hypothetical protein